MKLLLISIALLLLVNGCSILPKSADVHDFGIQVATKTSNQTIAKQPLSITIEAPKWLYDNRIRYRLLYANQTNIRFYMQDKWLAAPPDLFGQLLAESGLHFNSPITVTLQEFEQQFNAPGQANVVMHFTVTSSADKKNVIREETFHLHLSCPTPDAKGAVTGFSALSKTAVDKVRAWLLAGNSH